MELVESRESDERPKRRNECTEAFFELGLDDFKSRVDLEWKRLIQVLMSQATPRDRSMLEMTRIELAAKR